VTGPGEAGEGDGALTARFEAADTEDAADEDGEEGMGMTRCWMNAGVTTEKVSLLTTHSTTCGFAPHISHTTTRFRSVRPR
jgi:hypothetical protein